LISSDGFFKAVICRAFGLAMRVAFGPYKPRSGGKGRMEERGEGEEEDRLLRARLETLSGALQSKRKESLGRVGAEDGGDTGKFGSAMGLGLRASSEFVAAIVVGALIGWGLDYGLGTKPAFSIIFFMLGVAAGVWNVIRVTSPSSRGELTQGGSKMAPDAARKAPAEAIDDED
jgi:ATP synthase protein I